MQCCQISSPQRVGIYPFFSKDFLPAPNCPAFLERNALKFRKKSPTPNFFVSLARNHATFRKFGVDPSIDQRCLREACNLMLVDQHQTAEPAEPASSSSRFVGPKVHQTPFDLLEGLLPSREFSILLDENAWRFRVECKVKGQVFEPPYQNKTFSRAFNETTVTWQEALQEIHKYMWKKWDLIKKKAPMLSTEMQEPGHVNQEAFSMAWRVRWTVFPRRRPTPKNYDQVMWLSCAHVTHVW